MADVVKMDSPSDLPPKMKSKKPKSWCKALDMATICFSLAREQKLARYSFAVLFKGKWGSHEAKAKQKAKKKKEKAEAKPKPEVKPVEVEDKMEIKKPSQLLNLWSQDDKQGGRTVLGREADLLLLSWGQQERVAAFFTGQKRESVMQEREVVRPTLEPAVLVTLVSRTLFQGRQSSLEEGVRGLGLLFPYYQTRGVKCARLVRGVFR